MGAIFSSRQDAQQHLKKLQNVDPRIEVIVDPTQQEEQEIINVVKEGLSGDKNHEPEPTWKWWFGEEYYDFQNPKRKELFEYYSKFCVKFTLSYGVVFIIRDQNTKQIAGVALMGPPDSMDKGDFQTTFRIAKTGIVCGKPPNADNSRFAKDVEKRGNILTDSLSKFHLKYGKDPHWYLYLLCVKPEFQNQDYEIQLIKLFNLLAENDKTKSYVELAGDEQMKLYQQFGYEVQESFELQYEQYKCPHKIYIAIKN